MCDMQSIQTKVVHVLTDKYLLIDNIFTEFAIAALTFCFTCLLNVKLVSRYPPKYCVL